MRLQTVDYIIWWGTPVLMLLIVVAMYHRRLHREFPVFFNYVIFQIISFVVEYPLFGRPSYFYVSWTLTALSIAVSFGVLLEIFKEAFRPYEALRDLSIILFRWCALVVLLVSAMWALTSWNGNQVDSMLSVILLVDRSVRLMQCGLVFFMLLFSEYLVISRRNAVFGISVGFGFYAAVKMLVLTAANHQTLFTKSVLGRISSIAYLVSMLIWLVYSVMPVKARVGAKQRVTASEKWDSALDEVRNPLPAVSLLDSMDQTVERLLYHHGTEAGATVPTRR
ncbi:MAG TPA: hypothetical protein VN620_11180 [Candidatus Methylomirabilis sp.]|nr:hypothetical protein [Candidatus Methylomirabilis sp.]